MSCDMTIFCEVKKPGAERWEIAPNAFPPPSWASIKKQTPSPFNWQNYTLYGFLANVRNYCDIPPITNGGYFLPKTVSEEVFQQYTKDEGTVIHNITQLTLQQLLEYDYDQKYFYKREGSKFTGKEITVRQALGEKFFRDLDIMTTLGSPENVRIIFWFDN